MKINKIMVDTNKSGEEIQTNWTESVQSFSQLNLKEELLRGIFGI